MLARIAEDGDIDAVVVHKIDRLARNMEDHVAIRALLRRRGVTLVSVTENLEETASGRLVEGIHALMAEFYSANLASEIKKGMAQKAKMGGWPHSAPLGYTNVRETIGGRQVAHIVCDPERAPHITSAFALYATGEWTIERLVQELDHRGLRNRARRDRTRKPDRRLGTGGHSRQQGLRRHRLVERRRVPRTAPAPHRHGHLHQGPRPPGGTLGTRDARAPPQPLPEGHALLRGVRPGPLGPTLQGPLRVPLLPSGAPPQPDKRCS